MCAVIAASFCCQGPGLRVSLNCFARVVSFCCLGCVCFRLSPLDKGCSYREVLGKTVFTRGTDGHGVQSEADRFCRSDGPIETLQSIF